MMMTMNKTKMFIIYRAYFRTKKDRETKTKNTRTYNDDLPI